jgi:phosphate:Na+ symporter
MSFPVDIWKMVAGVAIFLLGMNFLEEGLKGLAARSFKLFLKRNTSNKLKALFGGAVVTAVLQSSSIVNLMVLALVGTGIIQMQNALAIMLGANLGTTFTSWILATAGFGFSIESLALPLAGVSGIIMMLIRKENRWKHWSKLVFGFSFLFFGLGYIKTGMENAVQEMDLGLLSEQPAIVFLLAGIVITTLIQSSSATVAIVLSALYANAIDLFSATAIVLGAEVGTTVKLVLASVNGPATKKRVALGNLLFNIIITALVFIFLLPLNRFIIETVGIRQPLIALVFFQSMVNISGILIFYPFLGLFSRFLQKRFRDRDDESLFINKQLSRDTELALEALEKESQNFTYHVMSFITDALGAASNIPEEKVHRSFHHKATLEKYDYIKVLYGEMHGFYIQVQNSSSSGEETERLEQLISSVRNWMYAAKNIRDALMDIDQLKKSSNDTKYNFYLITRTKMEQFVNEINRLMQPGYKADKFEDITRLHQLVQKGYTESLQELYKGGVAEHLNELEISTLINFNREMYTAFKSMVFALKDYFLNSKEAAYFDELPGFIR